MSVDARSEVEFLTMQLWVVAELIVAAMSMFASLLLLRLGSNVQTHLVGFLLWIASLTLISLYLANWHRGWSRVLWSYLIDYDHPPLSEWEGSE